MTYGDLINRDICIKLSMVSFESPKKNLEVYKFVKSLDSSQEFFEIEKSKILEKYGKREENGYFHINGEENVSNYKKEILEVLNMEIEDGIYNPNLSEDDFSGCRYPDDKNLWMSANDIDAVLSICSKLK